MTTISAVKVFCIILQLLVKLFLKYTLYKKTNRIK